MQSSYKSKHFWWFNRTMKRSRFTKSLPKARISKTSTSINIRWVLRNVKSDQISSERKTFILFWSLTSNIFSLSYLTYQKATRKFLLILLFAVLISDCDPDSEYACPDGSCIPAVDKCNRIEDCPGGEDEADCGELNLHSFISFYWNVVRSIAWATVIKVN